LPSKSAEFGHDEDVVETIEAMFPDPPGVTRNKQGGMAVFLKNPSGNSLRNALDSTLDVYDVDSRSAKSFATSTRSRIERIDTSSPISAKSRSARGWNSEDHCARRSGILTRAAFPGRTIRMRKGERSTSPE
jgi:hypothetical protein